MRCFQKVDLFAHYWRHCSLAIIWMHARSHLSCRNLMAGWRIQDPKVFSANGLAGTEVVEDGVDCASRLQERGLKFFLLLKICDGCANPSGVGLPIFSVPDPFSTIQNHVPAPLRFKTPQQQMPKSRLAYLHAYVVHTLLQSSRNTSIQAESLLYASGSTNRVHVSPPRIVSTPSRF